MGMLVTVRRALARRFEAVAETVGFLVSLSGASAAAVLGRLMLALVLGALALGLLFRLSGRRRAHAAKVPAAPAWIDPASALLSAIEVGMLVETINLPLRFHQEGFAMNHWWLVATALVAAFWIQRTFLRAVFAKRQAPS